MKLYSTMADTDKSDDQFNRHCMALLFDLERSEEYPVDHVDGYKERVMRVLFSLLFESFRRKHPRRPTQLILQYLGWLPGCTVQRSLGEGYIPFEIPKDATRGEKMRIVAEQRDFLNSIPGVDAAIIRAWEIVPFNTVFNPDCQHCDCGCDNGCDCGYVFRRRAVAFDLDKHGCTANTALLVISDNPSGLTTAKCMIDMVRSKTTAYGRKMMDQNNHGGYKLTLEGASESLLFGTDAPCLTKLLPGMVEGFKAWRTVELYMNL